MFMAILRRLLVCLPLLAWVVPASLPASCAQTEQPLSSSPKEQRFELSQAQREWLTQHPKITMGMMNAWPPISYENLNGQPAGVTVEIAKALNKRLGGAIELKAAPFKENYQAVLDGKLDGLFDITPRPDREKLFNFTSPYQSLPHAVIARKDSDYIGDEKALKGKIVALEKGFYNVKRMREPQYGVTVKEYDDTETALDAVARGAADAYVGNRAVATYVMGNALMHNLKVHGRATFPPVVLAIGTHKDNEILRDILEAALRDIGPQERHALFTRWSASSPHQQTTVSLSEAEKAYIEKHPSFTLAATPDWPPFEFKAEDGTYKGITADFIRLAASKVGLQPIPVIKPWADLIKDLEKGKIDVAPGLFKTPAREKFLTYGDLIVDVYDAIYTKTGQTGISSPSDFTNKIIVVERGYANHEVLAKNHPDARLLVVESTLEALQSLIAAKADLYVGNQIVANYLIKKHLLANIQVSGFYSNQPSPLYFAAQQGASELFSILSKGFDAITEEERTKIIAHWIGRQDEPKIALTPSEKAWIKDHPEVTYSEIDWKPMSIIEGGRMVGVMGDYLDTIENLTGLRFKFVEAQSWPDVLEKFKNKEIDLVPGIGNSEREAKLGFISDPYAKFPLVIVGREDASFVNGPEDLVGKVDAIPKYFTSYNYIKENFPQLNVRETAGIKEALTLVSDGKADAFIGHKLVAIYNIESLYLKNLKIIGLTTFNFLHGILVQKTAPPLLSILNKAIAAIDEKTKQRIYDDWVQVTIEESFDYSLLYKIGTGIFVVIVLIVYWNRKLQRTVDNKTAELRKLLNSLEDIVEERTAELAEREKQLRSAMDNMTDGIYLLDKDLRFVVFNEQYREYMGLNSDLIGPGKPVKDVIRAHAERGDYGEGNIDEIVESRFAVISDDTSSTREMRLADGSRILQLRKAHIEGGGAVVVVSDVTDVTKAREELERTEERTRLILESIGEGVFGVDLEGRVSFANSKTLQLLGYETDELVGAKVHDLIHHSHADGSPYPVEECPMWRAYSKGITSRIEDEVLWRKDGSPFPVEYSATPIRRGSEIIGSVIAFNDETERRESQELIKKQERQLRTIINNIPLVIILKDKHGRHLTVNNYYEVATGAAPDIVLGKTDDEFLPAEAAQAIMDMDKEILASGKPHTFEEKIPNPDGTLHDFLTTKAPIIDEKGNVDTLVIAALDITERKKAESELTDAYNIISDSIRYAANIQKAVLTGKDMLAATMNDHLVLWEPRDVVGGDIYWCHLWEDGILVVLADCTGHGVPGAFMTLIATGALDRAMAETPPGQVGNLINRMHQIIQIMLSQHGGKGDSDDGLDLGACYLTPEMDKMIFAGARFSLFHIEEGEVVETKGTKKGVGYRGISFDQTYQETVIPLKSGQSFYMTSDGYLDQVGGERKRMFGKKRFKELLLSMEKLPFTEQKKKLYKTLLEYQNEEVRRDDVSVVGFKI